MLHPTPRTVLLAVATLLGAAALLPGCSREAPAAEPAAATVRARVQPVAASVVPSHAEAIGSLESLREVTLSGKVMGTILSIEKTAGESVRRGERLVVIDARDVEGQIRQAEGALAQARAAASIAAANRQRFEALFARGSASPLELDQARFQDETSKGAVAQAEGALAAAKSYSAYAEIAAPFDGRVVDRMCEVGEMAAPGRPLLRIEDPARLRLRASLPESEAAGAAPGGKVDVVIPSLGDRPFEGTIAEVVPAVDPATRSVLLKIDLAPDPALRSGMYARAIVPIGTRRAIRVPEDAIRRRGGLTGVFVVEEGRARYRLVQIDASSPSPASQGGTVEVVAGLDERDSLLLDPPATLVEGTRVEVVG